MFQIRVMCFSNRLEIHKFMIKVWHSIVINNWYSKCTYYIYFVHNLLRFPTAKEFSKLVNI